MTDKKRSRAPRKAAEKAPPGAASGEAALSFEEALARLETIVTRLEDGEVPLEESIQAYAEGTKLVQACLARLDRAETLIRELSENAGGFRLEASRLGGGEEADATEDEGEDEEDEGDDELPF